MKLLHLLLIGVIFLQDVNAARILSAEFFASRSHLITYQPLLVELAKRGHEVTTLGPYPTGQKIPTLKEYTTIDIDTYFEEMFKSRDDFFSLKEKGDSIDPFWLIDPIVDICRQSYVLEQTKKILSQKYDLVIIQPLFNECLAGLVHQTNASLILVSPVVVPPHIAGLLGTPSPPSFIPTWIVEYGQDMNFYQRMVNFIMLGVFNYMQDFYFKPPMEKLYREIFNDQSIPSVNEIWSKASLAFSNSHFSYGMNHPVMPDIISVGGMHCRPAKPLPKDLETFVQGSGDAGFIYFSMGSALKGSTMPDKYRKIFLKVFGKLKQRILWKWETETMEGLPSNVKLSKWLPQQDILGHPKIKMFMTHGGMGSTTETIYHGVPLLGIPMFGDQIQNQKKAEAAGYSFNFDIVSMTEDNLYAAIQEVLTNQSYANIAKKLSNQLRDQPEKPLDRAVYWTEYVLRHKGAPHLRSPARDLNLFQYYSVDVIAFLFGIIGLLLFLAYKTLSFILGKIFGKTNSKSVSNGVYSNGKKTN